MRVVSKCAAMVTSVSPARTCGVAGKKKQRREERREENGYQSASQETRRVSLSLLVAFDEIRGRATESERACARESRISRTVYRDP